MTKPSYTIRAWYHESENAWMVSAGQHTDGTDEGWQSKEHFGPGYDGYDSKRKADQEAQRIADEQGYEYETPIDYKP